MICPRCSTPMKLAMNGAYQCPECWDKAEPVQADPAAPVEGTALALQRLQRRIGRLEIALADPRRRTQTSDEQGRPYCFPGSESGYRGSEPKPADAVPPVRSGVPPPNLGPQAAMAAVRSVHDGAELRHLRERVARLESAVADLRRQQFLGSDPENEEPRRGEPGERR